MALLLGRPAFATILVLLSSLFSPVHAQGDQTEYVYGTDANGDPFPLSVGRYPALYTGDFGDCLGGQSLFNITKFDTGFYRDNMTVTMHLDGASSIRHESLMLVLSMDAYGKTRYSRTFDPCGIPMQDLCPLNSSRPINGYVAFTLSPEEWGAIPSTALNLPDFEGYTRLQIFANSSQTEIGCFQAVVTNGNTFAHPQIIAPILAGFTILALLASTATAIYGVSIPHMRIHHAHSLSVMLVFETFQTIFFSGALSVKWPHALVAWWSNFAWSAGIIYAKPLVDAVGPFAGVSGNASQVGGAGSTVINNNGGLAGQIYGRPLQERLTEMASVAGDLTRSITKRKLYDASNPRDYAWGGDPVTPGMPLPGTWTGFAGLLSNIGIPAVDAFLLSLIWLSIALGLVIVSTITFKAALEVSARIKWIKEDRLLYFRSHYLGYTSLAVLRTLYVAFFTVMTLSIFQFAITGSTGATAVTGAVFGFLLISLGGLVVYACRVRLRHGRFSVEPDTIIFTQTKAFGTIPWVLPRRASTLKEKEIAVRPAGSLPFIRIAFTDDDPSRTSVHEDEAYVKRFGWLSARYRRTRWWFFAYYLAYQLFRACFIGGGVANPLAQVYGLFVYEVVALIVMATLNPFEGRRNTAVGVWMLSICKIVTTAVSIAFLPDFKLDRITAIKLGFFIVGIQGLLIIAVLILVTSGLISSWFSLSRNREDFEPDYMDAIRLKYFENLEIASSDSPLGRSTMGKKSKKGKEKDMELEVEPQPPKPSYFSVNQVRRTPKIEDDEEEDGGNDVLRDMEVPSNGPAAAEPTRSTSRLSRSNSVSSRYSVGSLPRGSHPRQTSWSAKDFAQWDASITDTERPVSPPLITRRSYGTLNGISTGDSTANKMPRTVRPQPSLASMREESPEPSTPTSLVSPISEAAEDPMEEISHNPPPPPSSSMVPEAAVNSTDHAAPLDDPLLTKERGTGRP